MKLKRLLNTPRNFIGHSVKTEANDKDYKITSGTPRNQSSKGSPRSEELQYIRCLPKMYVPNDKRFIYIYFHSKF